MFQEQIGAALRLNLLNIVSIVMGVGIAFLTDGTHLDILRCVIVVKWF